MFKSWDELSKNEQLHAEYYDFYKEVHGTRPRWIYDNNSNPVNTEAEMEQMLQRLSEEAKDVFAAEEEAAKVNALKFEETVSSLCENLNKDRDTIVNWMFDGSDGDWGHYEFSLGVPYGYFNEFDTNRGLV